MILFQQCLEHSCSSVAKSCPTLCVPMEWSMPGFPVLHYLLEFAQTHVHWVSDAIQPSHSLLPPSPLLSLSQHQGLYQWPWSLVKLFASGWSIRASASASVLLMNIQGWFPLGLTGLVPHCPRDSQSSSEPQFESINSPALNLLYGPTLISVHNYWKNHSFDYTDLCQQSDVSAF